MSISNLIPPEQWKLLKQAPSHLKDYRYLVVCDTCHVVFLDKPFSVIREELAFKVWDSPQRWYVEACRHWVRTQFCVIMVYVVSPSGKAPIKNLTEEWKAQIPEQLARLQRHRSRLTLQQAMNNELDLIEKQYWKQWIRDANLGFLKG